MCYQKNIFLSLTTLCKPYMVSLPNGDSVEVLYSRKVLVNKDITLHEALYVPTFKFNLLSISKLCKQLHCLAIFTEDSCLVQAPSMKRLQVRGKSYGGLYLVESALHTSCGISRPVNVASSTVSLTDTVVNDGSQNNMVFVWHARLGHLPLHKLQKLGLLSSSVSNDLIKMCSVCSKAR